MASEVYWVPLTRFEYEEGRERRLYPDSVDAKNWYNLRAFAPSADALGCYAVEVMVEIVQIKPNEDVHTIQINLLDIDGQKADEDDCLLSDDGFIIVPMEPEAEAYLLDANEELAGDPRSTDIKILIPA